MPYCITLPPKTDAKLTGWCIGRDGWRSLRVATALMLLTGCAQPATTGFPSAVAATGSDGVSTSPRQIGSPVANGNAGISDPNIVRAGSFPRSFLIPGTNTSIRIGG